MISLQIVVAGIYLATNYEFMLHDTQKAIKILYSWNFVEVNIIFDLFNRIIVRINNLKTDI